MNQRMYINYLATIYYLESIYDILDYNLKVIAKDVIDKLKKDTGEYKIVLQDHKLNNFKVEELDYMTMVIKTKQTIGILISLTDDIEYKNNLEYLLDYIKNAYKMAKIDILKGRNGR